MIQEKALAEDLEHFAQELRRWSKRINLVSSSTFVDIEKRHIMDSAQLMDIVHAPVDHWLDIGSGGGLPGLIIAIYAKHGANISRVTLIESDKRKSVFLSEMIRLFDLPAQNLCDRIEAISPQKANIISARALAPLCKLCSFAKHHLKQDGAALWLKGKNWKDELIEAEKEWCFQYEMIQSKTDPSSVILQTDFPIHASKSYR